MQIPPLVGYFLLYPILILNGIKLSHHTQGGRKKLFQSHQSEKLSNIILFIQDNFILLSMHKMLEKKMQTFTHSRWMDTPFFHLQIFRKFLSNPIRLQETATISTHDLFKNPDNNVEYSQHMVNVSTFFSSDTSC